MTLRFLPQLLVVNLIIPVITGTFYRILPDVRAVAQRNTIVRIRSIYECAIMCKSNETCVMANFGSEDFVCELMSVEARLSHFSAESTGKWQTLVPCQTIYNQSCFAVIPLPFRWSDARDKCITFGGRLAEVTNAQVNDQLKTFVNENDVSLWIGGEADDTNQWRWTTTDQAIAWADWYPGYPDHADERCLGMRSSDSWAQSNGQWNDAFCSLHLMHVCEFVLN